MSRLRDAIANARLFLAVVFLCPISTSFGKDPESGFDVPGGGILSYEHDNGANGGIRKIFYSGPPEWLVSQQDPRSHWHELPALRAIELSHTTITRQEMEYIASLKRVTSTEINETILPGEALVPLGKMSWLQSLDLNIHHLHGVTSDHWAFLDTLADLEHLSISGDYVGETTFTRICGLNKLRTLSLMGLHAIPAETAAMLERLPLLEAAWFGVVQGDATPLLEALSSNRKLRNLQLHATQLDATAVECISEMAGLERLYLSASSCASVSLFASLDKLRVLQLASSELGESDAFGFLSDMPQLQRLVLHKIDASDFSIDNLRGHQELVVLEIPAVVLRDDDIAVLESMPKLRQVKVGNQANSPWHHSAKHRLPGLSVRAVGSRRPVPPTSIVVNPASNDPNPPTEISFWPYWPNGAWNLLEIFFMSARWSGGVRVRCATITVRIWTNPTNVGSAVTVHDRQVLVDKTSGSRKDEGFYGTVGDNRYGMGWDKSIGPIVLQEHDNFVQFRAIEIDPGWRPQTASGAFDTNWQKTCP